MFLKNVRDIAKPQHFAIIDLLKRSTGLPVATLARHLDMSYMGVKQHCLDLEKKGWLDTWRRPVPNGRPEKLYRLTAKGTALFPESGSDLMLEMMRGMSEIFGPSAPEKLLFNYFQKKTSNIEKKLKGATPAERASHFSRLRNAEGHFSEMEYDREHGALCIVEWHNPHHAIATAYPSFYRHEEQMIQRLLGTTVQREEQKISGLTRIVFLLPGISASDARVFLDTPEGRHVKSPAAEEAAEAVPCIAAEQEEADSEEGEIAEITATAAPVEAVMEEPAAGNADAAEPVLVLEPQMPAPAPVILRGMAPVSEESRIEELPLFSRFAAEQELPEAVLSN